jgi:hypothetical protein
MPEAEDTDARFDGNCLLLGPAGHCLSEIGLAQDGVVVV